MRQTGSEARVKRKTGNESAWNVSQAIFTFTFLTWEGTRCFQSYDLMDTLESSFQLMENHTGILQACDLDHVTGPPSLEKGKNMQ